MKYQPKLGMQLDGRKPPTHTCVYSLSSRHSFHSCGLAGGLSPQSCRDVFCVLGALGLASSIDGQKSSNERRAASRVVCGHAHRRILQMVSLSVFQLNPGGLVFMPEVRPRYEFQRKALKTLPSVSPPEQPSGTKTIPNAAKRVTGCFSEVSAPKAVLLGCCVPTVRRVCFAVVPAYCPLFLGDPKRKTLVSEFVVGPHFSSEPQVT